MDYNQKFEVQVHSLVQNDCGDVSEEWAIVYAGYAHVRSLGSTEFWQAQALQENNILKFFCRWDKRLDLGTRESRIVWHGKELDIKSIENVDMRNEQCVIRAEVRDG